MSCANHNGVRIYYETEGHGLPLVLAHGRGGGLQAWRRQGYAEALRSDLQLVLIDARGHGRSDKPHEPAAYSLPVMAEDVVAVLDDLGINQARYFGYSMGGRIAYWLASHHAERFESFIIGGAAPFTDKRDAGSRKQIVEMLGLILKDPQAALLRRHEMLQRPLTHDETEAFLAVDGEALMALAEAIEQWPPLTDHEVLRVSVPCLVLCGDNDQSYAGAQEKATLIPHSEFVSLPGLNHSQAFERSDLVLPHVTRFLAEAAKSQIGH